MEAAGYVQFLPGLLVASGAALQWFRADRRFSERTYVAVAVVLAVAAHLLVVDYAMDPRLLVLSIVVALPQSLVPVLGGTQAVSTLANLAAKAGFNPGSPVVPVTNSK